MAKGTERDLIGIGAAVTRRPLPHHRAYGSVPSTIAYFIARVRIVESKKAKPVECRGLTHVVSIAWP
jgi:hypothetical protein